MDNFQEKISVIIPVYNAEKYLDCCLKSITENTYKNLDVICVNDGSTDNSLEILNNWASDDERIRVIDKANGGVSDARNYGIKESKGDCVAFVDADDSVHPQYFEILLKEMKKNNADISCCSYCIPPLNNPNIYIYIYNEYAPSKLVDKREQMWREQVWRKLYRKEIISDLSFPLGVKWEEDGIFNIQLMAKHEPVVCFTECPLYFYRNNDSSLTHSLKESALFPTVDWYYEFLAKTTLQEDILQIVVIRALKNLFLWRYLASVTSDRRVFCKKFKHCKDIYYSDKKFRHCLSPKEKVLYDILLHIPQLYRLFRIIQDPTLRGFEKKLKEGN